MKKKTNKITLSMLKYNVMKARCNKQIPFKLSSLILSIDKDTPLNKVEYLKEMSEHYLRVKGYYKRYPQLDEEYGNLIEKQYNKL